MSFVNLDIDDLEIESRRGNSSGKGEGGAEMASSSTSSLASSVSVQQALVNDTLNELRDALVDALSDKIEKGQRIDKKSKKVDLFPLLKLWVDCKGEIFRSFRVFFFAQSANNDASRMKLGNRNLANFGCFRTGL